MLSVFDWIWDQGEKKTWTLSNSKVKATRNSDFAKQIALSFKKKNTKEIETQSVYQ